MARTESGQALAHHRQPAQNWRRGTGAAQGPHTVIIQAVGPVFQAIWQGQPDPAGLKGSRAAGSNQHHGLGEDLHQDLIAGSFEIHGDDAFSASSVGVWPGPMVQDHEASLWSGLRNRGGGGLHGQGLRRRILPIRIPDFNLNHAGRNQIQDRKDPVRAEIMAAGRSSSEQNLACGGEIGSSQGDPQGNTRRADGG